MTLELEARPESGFLGHVMARGVIVQYWRSFDHLESDARDRDQRHWPETFDTPTGFEAPMEVLLAAGSSPAHSPSGLPA